MANFLLDLLFPKKCVGCGKFGSYLCDECLKKIQFLKSQKCLFCERSSIGGMSHPKCKGKYSIDGAISLAKFDGPLRKSIHQLKYRRISDLTSCLVYLLQENLWRQKQIPEFQFTVTAVPMFSKKENQRGFNQAAIFAKELAKRVGFEFDGQLLVKAKNTKAQMELGQKERKVNLRGAFKMKNGANVKGKDFLIFDDLRTTGTTLKECAQVIKRAGAGQVWGLTLAATN